MQKSFTIHNLPKSERPRERMQKFGPEALFSQELLAPNLTLLSKLITIVTKTDNNLYGHFRNN